MTEKPMEQQERLNMSRWPIAVRGIALAAAAVTASTALLTGSAFALAGTAHASDPWTPFGAYSTSAGGSRGTITWYNRSVRISGWVSDNDAAGSNQIRFGFFQGNTPLDGQTRTASNEVLDFGWTQEGPRGGITMVWITLCDRNACTEGDRKFRP
jgi:hypothetical protein